MAGMLGSCFILVSSLVTPNLASWGDQSSFYILCGQNCRKQNCQSEDGLTQWQQKQSIAERLVGWECIDDCKYDCMWATVDEMKYRHGQVPQFHGKWPFVRLFGIQEPASTFFSILNLLSNLYMLNWFIKIVPFTNTMFYVWFFYSLTAINAWFWSTVFHTRDTIFTEMMDYFCAFSTVLFSLLVFCLRIVGTNNSRTVIVTSLFAAFFSYHIYNMAFIRFDYGYNMKVNVVVGAINGISWLAWCFWHSGDGPHVRKGVTAVLILTGSVLLELLDFPPFLWTIDAHSLWHLATAPLPLLWYKFAAGDCLKISRDDEYGRKKIA